MMVRQNSKKLYIIHDSQVLHGAERQRQMAVACVYRKGNTAQLRWSDGQ